MTISTIITAAESSATVSPQRRQRKPRKSHRPRRQSRPHPAQGDPLQDRGADLLPEEAVASCLRFYKGRSGRERRQFGPAAVAMATAVAAARRARRRWAKRRGPRASQLAGAWERHNCSQSSDATEDISASRGMKGSTIGVAGQDGAPVFDHPMLTRLRNRTTTTDTRSSGTGSTMSSILNNVYKENEMIDKDPFRMQYIFHGGRLRAVQVMKWPEKHRIPTSERYRHEEPMKRRYGRKSLLCRLVRGLELSRTQAGPVKSSDFRRPIPLLPRRMIESTKSRLLLWYKPLESSGEFHAGCQAD